ncbi:hypothetical protein A0U20_07680 [Campylobacter lari]|nr:hypothetical protein [Campylobacter lari]
MWFLFNCIPFYFLIYFYSLLFYFFAIVFYFLSWFLFLFLVVCVFSDLAFGFILFGDLVVLSLKCL